MDDPLRVMRELKGSGVMTLVALGSQKEAVPKVWIQHAVGLSDKTVSQALEYLEKLGYADSAEESWSITEAGASLLLQVSPRREAPEPAVSQPANGSRSSRAAQTPARPMIQDTRGGAPETALKNSSRKISGACCINKSINTESLLIDLEKQKQSDFDPEKFRPKKEPAEITAIWRELRVAGIHKNPRTEALVSKPGISAAYVRAHREQLVAEGQDGAKWAGLLITILERGEPVPKLPGSIICPVCHQYPCLCGEEDP